MENLFDWVNPIYSLAGMIISMVILVVCVIIEIRKDRKVSSDPNVDVEEYALTRYNGEMITITLAEKEGDIEIVQINRLNQ